MKTYITHECDTQQSLNDTLQQLDRVKLCDIQLDDGGIIRPVNNYKGVYNISQDSFCAAVVPYYNLISHRELIYSTSQVLNRLNIKYTVKINQQGNKVFADFNFIGNEIKLKNVGEQFTAGVRVVNSYDKSRGIQIAPRFTRLACSNGMIITTAEKVFSVKHHSKQINDLESFIEKRIAMIISENQDLKKWVSASMVDSIEWNIVCKILEKLFDQPKHREEILKRIGISIITEKDIKTKKKVVSYVWDDEKNIKEKITRWELYNSITHYLTHGEHITPHIESLFSKKAEKVLVTPLIKL